MIVFQKENLYYSETDLKKKKKNKQKNPKQQNNTNIIQE